MELLDKLSKFYGITIDRVVHMNTEVPEVITKDKSILFSLIETMHTKKKVHRLLSEKYRPAIIQIIPLTKIPTG